MLYKLPPPTLRSILGISTPPREHCKNTIVATKFTCSPYSGLYSKFKNTNAIEKAYNG